MGRRTVPVEMHQILAQQELDQEYMADMAKTLVKLQAKVEDLGQHNLCFESSLVERIDAAKNYAIKTSGGMVNETSKATIEGIRWEIWDKEKLTGHLVGKDTDNPSPGTVGKQVRRA